MNQDFLQREFVEKYQKIGEEKFHQFLLIYALNKLAQIEKGNFKGLTPELEFLEYYNQFMILYRREGKEIYFTISKSFRKMAHKIYRIMIKKNLTSKNGKFLNMV